MYKLLHCNMVLLLTTIVLVSLMTVTLTYGYPQRAGGVFHDIGPVSDQLAEPSEKYVKIVKSVEQSPNAQSESANDDDDDSDMYLEPDGAETVNDKAEQVEVPTSTRTDRIEKDDNNDPTTDSQRFFPLFSLYNNDNNNNRNPPLGHSRPFVFGNQEAAYSHRPYSARQNLNFDPSGFRGFDDEFESLGKSSHLSHEAPPPPVVPLRTRSNLLGSGNFGVLRGGTFYNENDDISEFAGSSHHLFNPFYQNGHGRPASYYFNPKPTKHEPFANFRDFADINTPSNPAYSQFVIVYANKNATADIDLEALKANYFKPKNINERLAMLDQELELQTARNDDVLEKKKNKLSASKRKLALVLPEKKPWSKKLISTTVSPKDLYEPLLALSR